MNLDSVDLERLSDLPLSELKQLGADVLARQAELRQTCQILFYVPNSERAWAVHRSTTKYLGIGGGNGSGKTDSALAEIAALATGVFPDSLRDVFMEKFRGPINVRIVVESHTTTLVPTILPKLQWFSWSGVDMPGGERGHYGWIPKDCLIKEDWSKSWSEKNRLLTVQCRDPADPTKILGKSKIQFMSHGQDWSDFASGDYHIVMIDEPTREIIFRENEARTMRVAGRIILAMTWPDEPSIPVDWIYDKVYDPGQPGPNKSPSHDWFELWTTDNPHLNQESVAEQAANWSEEIRRVRLLGQPIRFSNRIHPQFTDVRQHWCFRCNEPVHPRFEEDSATCPLCAGREVSDYCHVEDFDFLPSWPSIFVLDPHPRKPHMYLWGVIDPADDVWVVAEGQIEGDCADVAVDVHDIETSLGLNPAIRLIDPNMGRSPASQKRDITWQDEFASANLACDLADVSDVGRARVNEYLKPDNRTWRPRMHIHTRCAQAVYQMKRYTWDEHRFQAERDLKQKPRAKYDDYPTMLKYLMNLNPEFTPLHGGAPVIHRRGERRGAY